MSDESLLDMQAINELREILGGDLDELYAEYLTDTHSLLNELERAAAQNDIATLTALAHTLKGSSGNLGIAIIYNLARELESAGRASSVADPRGAVQRIKEAFAAAQPLLNELAGTT